MRWRGLSLSFERFKGFTLAKQSIRVTKFQVRRAGDILSRHPGAIPPSILTVTTQLAAD